MADTINTDLSQYTIDELFNLFDIKITSYMKVLLNKYMKMVCK